MLPLALVPDVYHKNIYHVVRIRIRIYVHQDEGLEEGEQ